MNKLLSRKFIQSTLVVLLAFVLILARTDKETLLQFLAFAAAVTGIYHAANIATKSKTTNDSSDETV